MATASWLIGSMTFGAPQSVTIAGSLEEIPAGTYYLRAPSSPLSLIVRLLTAMTAAGVSSPLVQITQGRRVRITAGSSFTIVWGSVGLRDVLGFAGNVGATTAITAPRVSPLLWSPGWEETPASPIGTIGYPITDTVRLSSPSGLTQTTITHHTATLNSFAWDTVAIDRVWTQSGGSGGEFRDFYDRVLNPGMSFHLYRGVIEVEGSTTAAAYPSAPLGPYRLRSSSDRWYSRGVPNIDLYSPISIEAQVVTEYV